MHPDALDLTDAQVVCLTVDGVRVELTQAHGLVRGLRVPVWSGRSNPTHLRHWYTKAAFATSGTSWGPCSRCRCLISRSVGLCKACTRRKEASDV